MTEYTETFYSVMFDETEFWNLPSNVMDKISSIYGLYIYMSPSENSPAYGYCSTDCIQIGNVIEFKNPDDPFKDSMKYMGDMEEKAIEYSHTTCMEP